jgi:hypothetical protein
LTDLPFLYHHGPTFWLLAIVAFAALVLLTIWAIRYAIARGKVRATLRRVRSNHRAIRGVLRGGAATTVEIHSPNARHSPLSAEPLPPSGIATWRAESLWLETADRKLVLDGAIRVVTGTRANGKRRELPALATSRRDAVKEQLPWATKDSIATAVAIHVDAGDEIEVRGVIESRAGQGETGHREADIAWTVRGDDGPLHVAAVKPVVARVPLGLLRSVLVVGLALGVGMLVQRGLGEHWQNQCKTIAGEDLPGDRPLELDNGHPCVLAASVPKDREWSIQFLHRLLDDHRYRDTATVARLDAVARDAQDCKERVPQLYYRQRYEAAIEAAKACDMKWYQHESLVMVGRFEEAAALPVSDREEGHPALPAVSTLIAAGRWSEAAAAVRRQQISEDYPELRTYRGCLADWFGHLGGERESTARLHALAATDPISADAKECAGVLSEFEPARRRFWLANGDGRGRYINRVLAAAGGTLTYDPLGEPEDILLRPEDGGERDAASLWLPPGGDKPWQRAITMRWRAVKQMLDNEPEAALATARAMVAQVDELLARDDDDGYPLKHRQPNALIPSIQLYTNTIVTDLQPPRGELLMFRFGRLYLRSTQKLESGQVTAFDDKLDQALLAARTGDGKPLLDAIRRRFHTSWRDGDLLAVMPHIKNNREAFARELPHLPINNYIYGEHVFRNALNAFMRRELLEAVGALDEAKRWDEIYRRFDRVFRDRQKLVALVLYRD